MRSVFKIWRTLGLSFRSWARNFVPFMVLALLIYAPVFIWITVYDPAQAGSVGELRDKLFLWPTYLLSGLATLLAPMLTYRVIQGLSGAKVPMRTSVRLGLRGIVPAITVAIMSTLLGRVPGGGLLAAVLGCIWFVAAPAAVAEQLGPWAAFARSSELTRGRRWGIFGLNFVIGLVVIGLLALWILPLFHGPLIGLVDLKRRAYLFLATAGVVQLFVGITAAVSYALLRQDKEGISHEALARVFE